MLESHLLGELLETRAGLGGGEEKDEMMRDCFIEDTVSSFSGSVSRIPVFRIPVGQKKRRCIVCGCVWWIA